MKKLVALFAALIMLFSVCAMADEAPVTLYTAENGATVTLTMKGAYTIKESKTDNGETMLWVISREGVADVFIVITPCGDMVMLNDMSDEEIEAIIKNYADEYGDVITVSVEVTPSGNKYFDCFWDEGTSQMNERWTYFDGFELSRTQIVVDGILTDADTAFLAEVQEGMWVTFPETAE